MNRRFTLPRAAIAAALAALPLSVLAAPAQPAAPAAPPVKPAEKKLIAKVFNDGVLFGFAQNCKIAEPDLKKLYDKNFDSSRALGVSKVPQYSQANFRRDFQSGIATADKLSNSVAPTSKAFTKNCQDVSKKVQMVIQGK